MNNTYQEKYDALITRFKQKIPDKTKEYCEYHHIIPKSCGGTDKKENIVLLPGKWHFIAHYLLPFVMLERGNNAGYAKMCVAFFRMSRCSFSGDRIQETEETLKIKADAYEEFRRGAKQISEKHRLGSVFNPHTEKSRNKIRQTMKNKIGESHNPRIWISKNGVVKYIRKEFLQEYLEDNWELGRINYHPRKGKQGCKL